MSLTQQLLVRALGGPILGRALSRSRWSAGARRCTTVSCCRISSCRISRSARANCGESGLPFEPEWFAAAFRIPLSVARQRDLRRRRDRTAAGDRALARAGRGAGGGGTARYVDSSVERLQVKVSGMTQSAARRHLQRPPRAAASHGHRRANTWRACAIAPGSRRTACIPRSASTRRWCSTFSIVGNSRQFGGCTWHVSHPGGRNYDTFPVNAYEAESRRASRFFRMGHTGGRCAPPGRAQWRLSADA